MGTAGNFLSLILLFAAKFETARTWSLMLRIC
jgi:hypothetical protein